MRAGARETGSLDRTFIDTIENIVGIVEVLAERTFRSLVTDPDGILTGKGKFCQRLDDLADLFWNVLSTDVRAAVGENTGT